MLAYYGILFVGTLVQPLLALTAVLASLVARRLRHALAGGLIAGAVQILVDRLDGGHSTPVVMVLMAGITACLIAFLVRRELGIPSFLEKERRPD